jgi:hypothetical protein
MPKWQDNIAIRFNRRMVENRGKVCPVCRQDDPLLITENGRCAKCSSRHKQEKHHLLGKAYRVSEDENKFIIPVSLYAHRLLSDLQAGNPAPSSDDVTSLVFLESQLLEFFLSLVELWIVLTYLHEQPEVISAIVKIMCIAILILILLNLDKILSHDLVEKARRNLHEQQP